MNSQATTSSTTCEQKQQGEDAVGEQLRRRLAALAMDMRIGRHERRVEGALGENRPEMIGQPQRHEKRVRHRPAPRIAASMMSRANPVSRESSV